MKRYEVLLIDLQDNGMWDVNDGGVSFVEDAVHVKISCVMNNGSEVIVESDGDIFRIKEND